MTKANLEIFKPQKRVQFKEKEHFMYLFLTIR